MTAGMRVVARQQKLHPEEKHARLRGTANRMLFRAWSLFGLLHVQCSAYVPHQFVSRDFARSGRLVDAHGSLNPQVFPSPRVGQGALAASDDGAEGRPEYSRELLLREEAESPFRGVRFFAYASLGAGALTSLAISATRIAAAQLSGINTDLLDESITNAVIDLVGVVVLFALYQRDLDAQQSRLKRAAKGAELAKLKVRISKAVAQGDGASDDTGGTFTTSLSSLRRGRGIEKRVVITAAGAQRIEQLLRQIVGENSSIPNSLQQQLVLNDLIIVPVVLPQATPPKVTTYLTSDGSLPQCIALPIATDTTVNPWNFVVSEEADEAKRQGIDVLEDGFCIVLKKNGKVGQRTKGINLYNFVNEVVARREAGMDVRNI